MTEVEEIPDFTIIEIPEPMNVDSSEETNVTDEAEQFLAMLDADDSHEPITEQETGPEQND